jgi:hypothetical protein
MPRHREAKNPAATIARIASAMIFFMMPLLDYSTTFAAAVITFRAKPNGLSSQCGG